MFHPSLKVPQKVVSKCNNKIFRPWDAAEEKPNSSSNFAHQDATISTTTESETVRNEESEKEKFEPDLKKFEEETNKFPALHNPKLSPRQQNVDPILPFIDYSGNLESWVSHPEYLNMNLAHSLGLTPTDPLFLECLNQGYTIEEYTRVMSQEHQARILSARKQRPKKYRCPHCDVGFSNNGQLKGHIRIHTGERPFRCDESNCGKTFTRNEELTRHKRIHSGLRPFPCTHCGKRFGRKDHLKKHSRTHFQPRGLYAVPVMLPYETWSSSSPYPYVPMFTY